MKITRLMAGLIASAMCAGFTSCDESDDSVAPSYSTALITDANLRTALAAHGFLFDETGAILLTDSVKAVTSVDLSNANVDTAALKQLAALPALTDVTLSGNGYGPIFDFNSLPAQITGVDLTGNEIFDFENLVKATPNDPSHADYTPATTIVRTNLKKLYLPASAKYNIEDLMPYFTKNEEDGVTVDMQMADDNGTLKAYDCLRSVPDDYFRNLLKQNFASIFTSDDYIDISKPMAVSDMGNNLALMYVDDIKNFGANVKSLEGIEYIINNPFYNPLFIFMSQRDSNESTWWTENYEVSYLMPGSNIQGIEVSNMSTPKGFNLSKATGLAYLMCENNKDITELDFSNTLLGRQQPEDMYLMLDNAIKMVGCDKLEKIILPEGADKIICSVYLRDLPALKTFDMSDVTSLRTLVLINLQNCAISWPMNAVNYVENHDALYPVAETGDQWDLAIGEDVFNQDGTKEFIKKFKNNLSDQYISFRKLYYYQTTAYRWSQSDWYTNLE